MQQPTKQSTVRALMRNGDMAKLMKEAAESPIGSTPRKRAQKIVSIMKKVGAIESGGGPGYQTAMQMPAQGTQQAETVSQMKNIPQEAARRAPAIFPAPPRMKVAIDGKGGPGDTTPFLGNTSAPAISAPAPLSFSIGAANRSYTPTPDAAPTKYPPTTSAKAPYNSITGNPLVFPNLSKTTGLNLPYQDPMAASQYAANPMGIPRPFDSMTSSQSTPQVAPNVMQQIQQSAQQQQSAAQGNSIVPLGLATPDMVDPSSDPNSIYYDDSYGYGAQPGGEYQNLMGVLGMKDQTSDPYANVVSDSLYNALNSQMGASGFAYQMMNDPKELRKLPGFGNVPDDALPYGASISGQVGALAETLRKESGLDSMMSEYMKRLDSGASLETDLTDYIRGRDEFLNETQGLIDNFKDSMLDMDMANPVIAQRAKQYNDYLYTLKGRQNKRYIEFLNASVTTYENEMNNRKASIEMVSADLQRQIEFKGSLAVDEYNRYYTILTDMYQQAAGLPELEMQRQQSQANLLSTITGTIGDTVSSSSGVEYDENFRDAVKFVKSSIYDNEGGMLPSSRNFLSVMNEFASNDSGVGRDYLKAVTDTWTKGMQSDFATNAVTTQEAMRLLDLYRAGIDQYKNAQDNIGYATEEDQMIVQRQYETLIGMAEFASMDATRRSLSTSESTTALRAAVDALVRNGWVRGTPSRADWLADHAGDTLDRSFLDRLYTEYENFINANGGDLDTAWKFYSGNSTSDPGLSSISDQDLLNNIILAMSGQGGQFM